MEKENKTVVMRDLVFLDENLWKKVKMEEFDKEKKSTNPSKLTSYPICSLNKDGKLKEIDLLTYRRQNNLYFDVTHAPIEIKRELSEKYGIKICEMAVVPEQKMRTLSLIHPTSECFNKGCLTKEEKKALGSEYVLVESRENGFKISKCILFNGYGEEIADKVYLSVNLSSLTPKLLDKVISSIETFIPNEYGYYDYISQNEDTKQADKIL